MHRDRALREAVILGAHREQRADSRDTGAVAGETMRDWFRHAIEDPDTLLSRAEEGDFQTAVPGVHPFPCDVAP